jgi:chromosome segregation ATPase
MREIASRKKTLLAVLLAATLSATPAPGEDPPPSAPGDVGQLRTDAAGLLQQIEQLRAEITRLTRERDEQAKELAEARSALQTLRAEQQRRHAKTQESDPGSPKQAASNAVVTQAVSHASDRDRPDGETGAEENRGRQGNGTNVPAPQQGAAESPRRIQTLEAELRELLQREQTNVASAKDRERALDEEKRAVQSKLEALESVLIDARSGSTQLRAELDETRQRNNELSHEISEFHAATKSVVRPPADAEAREAHIEPTDVKALDKKMIHATSSPKGKTTLAARSVQVEKLGGGSLNQPTSSEASAAGPSTAAVEDPAVATDLREQLSMEREHRETLEEEVKRLTASGSSDEKFTEVWNALQSARSEILVLSNQLADERKSREDLEIALARTPQDPAGQPNTDLAQRLAQALNDRRSEADHLAAQLKDANEIIVRLKGRLEASGSPEAESSTLGELLKDNETLRHALKVAEDANEALREKAAMAQRLAEMVYGKGP